MKADKALKKAQKQQRKMVKKLLNSDKSLDKEEIEIQSLTHMFTEVLNDLRQMDIAELGTKYPLSIEMLNHPNAEPQVINGDVSHYFSGICTVTNLSFTDFISYYEDDSLMVVDTSSFECTPCDIVLEYVDAENNPCELYMLTDLDADIHNTDNIISKIVEDLYEYLTHVADKHNTGISVIKIEE